MAAVERPFRERLELRIAFVKADRLFETCDKLADADKLSLYDELKKRLVDRGVAIEASVPSPTAPIRFGERCLELATLAPNEKIRNVLLTIARICEVEADLPGDSTEPLQASPDDN